MEILQTRDDVYVTAAAQIWAEATAHRDRDSNVASLAESRKIIESVIDSSSRSFLLLALDHQHEVNGFAAVEPAVIDSQLVAELRYFGVRPGVWGTGVASGLVRDLPARILAAGFDRGALQVYTDNGRAVALYAKSGWQPVGEPTPHLRSGKLEQRYMLDVRC